MKALIFNSGIGKRMGELTAHCPKSMVRLYNDETIFERQIRLLQEAGIKEVIITTGPYPEMFRSICEKPCYGNMTFRFAHNEIYDSSNYIYSMFKAKDLLDDDILMMHGDLVFDRSLIPALLKDKRPNLCLINKRKALPEKDFKARIVDGELREVSIHIFDEDCCAFQPLYKLSKKTIGAWVRRVEGYVAHGDIKVYAENALNEISSDLHILPFSYVKHFIDEIDNQQDLVRVNSAIEQWDFKKQTIKNCEDFARQIKKTLCLIRAQKPMFVIDRFMREKVAKTFSKEAVFFSDFTPNPKYEEALAGLNLFREEHCDSIVSIGGGSCIDVAKSIKLGLGADLSKPEPFFRQPYKNPSVRHICVPSTSGTGSESTRHAVLYYQNEKQSICCSSILPDYVLLCPKLILTVPDYQKKCTAMDALCQCIESLWSKKATRQSRVYAKKGLKLFDKSYRGYINNEYSAVEAMQWVANYSGRAINISETTAAHAMSYKITSLFGIPHGHAVAICMSAIFERCRVTLALPTIDFYNIFCQAQQAFGLKNRVQMSDADFDELVKSVNKQRLQNFPFDISVSDCYLFCRKKTKGSRDE